MYEITWKIYFLSHSIYYTTLAGEISISDGTVHTAAFISYISVRDYEFKGEEIPRLV